MDSPSIETSRVRHILFDLGAVLLNIDYHKPVAAFAALGVRDFERWFAHAGQTELFDLFETGRIDRRAFADRVRAETGLPLRNDLIFAAWNSILLDLPGQRIAFLQSLKPRFTLSLLSNTNELHVEAFEQIAKAALGPGAWQNLFDGGIYYSNRIGMRKPHAETFERVLELAGHTAWETLFIDDTPRHVQGARAAGLQALLLPAGTEVAHLLSAHGIHSSGT